MLNIALFGPPGAGKGTVKKITRKILKFIRGEAYDWLIQDGSYDIEKNIVEEASFYLNLFSTFEL